MPLEYSNTYLFFKKVLISIYKNLTFLFYFRPPLHLFFKNSEKFPQSSKNCLVSVISEDFVIYFQKLYSSIKYHNPNQSFDWILLHDDKFAKLSSDSIELIKSNYKDVILKKIDYRDYSHFLNLVDLKYFSCLYKLAAFDFDNYKKLIFLDLDMICIGNLNFIFQLQEKIAVVPVGKNLDFKKKYENKLKVNFKFNAGLLIINSEILKLKLTNKLIKYKFKTEYTEQEILNNYFKYFPKYILPVEYNFAANFFYEDFNKLNVKIIHYNGPKPTSNKCKLREIWIDWKI